MSVFIILFLRFFLIFNIIKFLIDSGLTIRYRLIFSFVKFISFLNPGHVIGDPFESHPIHQWWFCLVLFTEEPRWWPLIRTPSVIASWRIDEQSQSLCGGVKDGYGHGRISVCWLVFFASVCGRWRPLTRLACKSEPLLTTPHLQKGLRQCTHSQTQKLHFLVYSTCPRIPRTAFLHCSLHRHFSKASPLYFCRLDLMI